MSFVELFLFLTGLGSTIKFSLGGDIFLPDLLLCLAIPFFFKNIHLINFRGVSGVILLLGGLWFLNQIITDAYRGSPFEDWSRGWAKILFFFVDALSLALISGRRIRPILYFLVGNGCSSILQTIFFPTEFQAGGVDFNDGAWKFGYAPGFTTLAAILGTSGLAVRLFGKWAQFAPLLIMGGVNLAFNYRSMFGIAIAAVAFGLLKRALDFNPRLQKKITPAFFVVMLGAGVIFGQGLISVYGAAAENGWLGIAAKDKYEFQTQGDLNLLQSGRMESLVSMRAISDLPILGHGSWARDVTYIALLRDILDSRGVDVTSFVIESDLIPSHSHLLGAWVEAGIMGGIFWTAVMALALGALYRTLKTRNAPGTFLAFVLIFLIWDVLFSPFGANQRFIKALQIGCALWVLNQPLRAVSVVV